MFSSSTYLGILFIALGILLLWLSVRYGTWKRRGQATLAANSQVVETAQGPLEFATLGQGPPILILHGSPGGYDQSLVFAQTLALPTYQFICVSRPGYLRSPLATGQTPAQQADAMAAFLDARGLDRVAVIGISGGGPCALEFALRHPARCWGLALVCAVTQKTLPEKPSPRMRMMSLLVQSELATNLAAIFAQARPRSMVPLAIPAEEQADIVAQDPEKLVLLSRAE